MSNVTTPPIKVISTVDNSPAVALMTGSDDKKLPDKITAGFVALNAALVGVSVIVGITVPTRGFNVA